MIDILADVPDPNNTPAVLVWALGGIAAFAAAVVWFVLRRGATKEDREADARERYLSTLAALPADIAALNDDVAAITHRIERNETDLVQLRTDLATLRGRCDALQGGAR